MRQNEFSANWSFDHLTVAMFIPFQGEGFPFVFFLRSFQSSRFIVAGHIHVLIGRRIFILHVCVCVCVGGWLAPPAMA